MENLRALRHEWFGREGLKPEEVEIFHRCCDELEQAINADSRSESAKDAELTRLKEQLARTERLVEVAEEFVKRCEAGEVRSVKTYAKFKDALAHLAGRVEG